LLPPGAFDPLICYHPGEFAIFGETAHARGLAQGNGHYWNYVLNTEVLLRSTADENKCDYNLVKNT